MSKPDNIPQDVWKLAVAISTSSDLVELETEIARSIMAAKAEEREAIAQYHDNMAAQHLTGAPMGGEDIAERQHHLNMMQEHKRHATAIRKRVGSP